MSQSEQWYIVKRSEGQCDLVVASELEANTANSSETKPPETTEHWGPFDSEGEAIARRVGLIRAGKCKPV
jgi:hypothetical protein